MLIQDVLNPLCFSLSLLARLWTATPPPSEEEALFTLKDLSFHTYK